MAEQEKKEEVKKEEVKEVKAAPAPAPAPAAAPEGGSKRIKLSRLSLEEVEEGLKTCQEKMGGLNSKHARVLLNRKELLTKKSS